MQLLHLLPRMWILQLYFNSICYYGCPVCSTWKPLCFTAVLYPFFSQTLFSEVTERIPFILSHNIRSRCNLMQPQKFIELYPRRKIAQKPPKMGISETESDIKWWITLQQNFTSTIAALVHYEGPSSVNLQKRVNFLTQKWGTSLSGILTPHRKIWDPKYLWIYER